MNFKDSLKALDTLDMLLQKKPLDVYTVYCENNGLVEPCENTEECLCEKFGPNYKERVCAEYSPKHRFAALNEDEQICSTNDLSKLCELKKLAEDFIAHYDLYMALDRPSKISIGDPEVEGQQCPTEDCKKIASKDSMPEEVRVSKIRDALLNVPDDVLLNIIMNYNSANNFNQIYQNTPENLAKLKGEGFTPNTNSYSEFNEYCQPTLNGGIESYDDPMQNVSEEELVPYIDENFDEYAEPLNITTEEANATCGGAECTQPLPQVEPEAEDGENVLQLNELDVLEQPEDLSQAEDEPTVEDDGELIEDAPDDYVLGLKWFEKTWKKIPAGPGRQEKREENIANILTQVKEAKERKLYNKLENYANRWKKMPSAYDYNTLKKDFALAFKENEDANAEYYIDEEEENTLKHKIVEAYNVKTGLSLEENDYDKLPESWKEKFDKLIARDRGEEIMAFCKKIINPAEAEEDEKEKEDMMSNDEKEEKFYDLGKKIIGMDFSNENVLKSYAERRTVDFVTFKNMIEDTLEAYQNKTIDFKQVIQWFRDLKGSIKAASDAKWLKTDVELAREEKDKEADKTLAEFELEDIPDYVKNHELWKKYFPQIAHKFKPDSVEYKTWIENLVKKIEAKVKGVEPDSDEIKPLTLPEFLGLFKDTPLYKKHEAEIKPIVEKIFTELGFDKVKYNAKREKFENANASNIVNVIEEVLTKAQDVPEKVNKVVKALTSVAEKKANALNKLAELVS